MSTRRQLLVIVLAAIALGAVVSGLLTVAWVNENLGGDFADQESGKIHLGYTAAIFLIWSAFLATPLAIVGVLAVLARRVMRRNGS